jgi:hypothetical protein
MKMASMDFEEKTLKLEALELALQDLDRIITTMKSNNYPAEQINEYVKKRWNIWNEIYKVRKT